MSAGPAISDTTTREGGVVLGRLEVDHFCDQCGYNLHGQLVTREPHTDLLVCRCSECGRFHPAAQGVTAGRLWLNRLALFLVLVWICIVVSVVLALGGAHLGICIGTLEELTETRFINPLTPPTSGPFTVPPGYVPRFEHIVRPPDKDTPAFLALMFGLTFALGYVLVTWLAVTMHHWRRVYYLVFIVAFALLAGTVETWMWTLYAPELSDWAALYIRGFGATCLVSGILAALTGRAAARLLVRIVLPPRPRQVLAFLWTADRLPLPSVPQS
jgi:hypothetical protein